MGIFDSIFGGGTKQPDTRDVEERLKAEAKPSGTAENGNSTFKVEDVYQITGVGCVAVGEVLSGVIKAGYVCDHEGKTYGIKSMEAHHKMLPEAHQGDKVGINLRGVQDKKDIKAGAILTFHE